MPELPNLSPSDRLIVALDVPTIDDASRLVQELGSDITFYKIGLELVMAGGLDFVHALTGMGKQVFLDMKLLDIANTVERAVANAAELGVSLLTVHGHDQKTLRAAVAGRGNSPLQLLAVTVLTSLNAEDVKEQGCSISPAELVQRRARLAYESGFDGVIASGQEAARIRRGTASDFLIVTPGIRLAGSAMDDQERVMTPDHAISAGADYLVVGRPISHADDRCVAARAFLKHIAKAQAPTVSH